MRTEKERKGQQCVRFGLNGSLGSCGTVNEKTEAANKQTTATDVIQTDSGSTAHTHTVIISSTKNTKSKSSVTV